MRDGYNTADRADVDALVLELADRHG